MKGVHAAIVTHFDDQLDVDHDSVAAEVSRLITAGVHGIVANGTVGEGGSLSREERRAVVETSVAAAGPAPVCAGVSAPTAEQASVYARDARSAGAETVMALPPLLYRADRRELVTFFGTVARAAELPLLVYNNPAASGSDLQPELLAELVAEVPSIAAIKETSEDARRIAHLVNLCPDVDIMVGGDDWALEGFCAGAAGWVSGVADVLPAECVRLWDLCQAGQLPAARAVYADLLPLARLDMTPKLVQYFKAALDEIGIGGGPCRPPRLPLTDEELAAVRDAVAQALSGAPRPGSGSLAA
ncbi:MAG TPA: dihydrodipicolinate synthase family protein [Solirubrobacteraceae bacterium]|nr:dihydrodipicolinate synthase family protein [Solirubrobacteraceae bacterium]